MNTYVAGGAAAAKGLTRLEQDIAAIKAANIAQAAKPQTFSKIEDLYGKTFDVIPLSHLPGPQNGALGEQLAIQLLNKKTGLNFKPLQNRSNYGCDVCAISIQGNTIMVVVADAKSSQKGVNAAKEATGDPAKRLEGWLKKDWADNPENKELADSWRLILRRVLKSKASPSGSGSLHLAPLE